MERGRGFNQRFRGRGRGMRGGGGFINGPMNGRGGMIRGGRGGLRPLRMGLGFQSSRGNSRGGRGGGRFPNQSGGDFFQNQQQSNDNSAPTPVQQEPEKPAATTPATTNPSTQSTGNSVGNNVQVVTTGPTPSSQQTTAPPSQQSQSQQPASVQSNAPSGGNFNSMPRGGDMRGGRGFSRGFSRGSFSRGRGSFSQGSTGMPPRQFDTRQPSNLTPALPSGPPKINRYDNSMQPPKRGRFESGPYNNRNMSQNQPPPMAPQHHQNSYNMPQHGNPSGYQDQTQYMDQYQHGSNSYNSMPPQSYPTNGQSYGQSSYGSQNSQMGYQEYDHNAGYQDYNASSYDARYANYPQDYRQSSYGTSTDSYGQMSSQDSTYASYETRSGYGNYDSYSQGYNSQSGYY